MDSDLYATLKVLSEKAFELWDQLRLLADKDSSIYCFRILKVTYLLVPIVAVMVVYNLLKYLLIYNACQYEEFVRMKYEWIKKVNKHLKLLAKRYGNFYFCYLPMNHGTALPKTYTLFLAIKDVLTNAERPASRALRMNLLWDLLQANHTGVSEIMSPSELSERGYFEDAPTDVDPLSEFNLDIMKCTRELIIQGVKDFDTMLTVYRVLETVIEES